MNYMNLLEVVTSQYYYHIINNSEIDHKYHILHTHANTYYKTLLPLVMVYSLWIELVKLNMRVES